MQWLLRLRYAFWLLFGDIPNMAETERSKGTQNARWCWRGIENMQIWKYPNMQILLEEEEDVRGGVGEGLQISWSFLEITTPALQLPFLLSSNRHLSIMMMRTTPGRLFTPLSNYRNTHAWKQKGASENSFPIQAVFVCKSFGFYGDNPTFIKFKLTWKDY